MDSSSSKSRTENGFDARQGKAMNCEIQPNKPLKGTSVPLLAATPRQEDLKIFDIDLSALSNVTPPHVRDMDSSLESVSTEHSDDDGRSIERISGYLASCMLTLVVVLLSISSLAGGIWGVSAHSIVPVELCTVSMDFFILLLVPWLWLNHRYQQPQSDHHHHRHHHHASLGKEPEKGNSQQQQQQQPKKTQETSNTSGKNISRQQKQQRRPKKTPETSNKSGKNISTLVPLVFLVSMSIGWALFFAFCNPPLYYERNSPLDEEVN